MENITFANARREDTQKISATRHEKKENIDPNGTKEFAAAILFGLVPA